MIKPGRPRLDDSPGFKENFATILPRLIAKEISQGQAARELGISVRSLKRYVKEEDALEDL
jgi:predicted transcriptional regulator